MTVKQNLIYICDFLNIFSDFREMKYKQHNINFHKIKDFNIIQDTFDFFNFFFTKFIKQANITINNRFIFIIKKIKYYDDNIFSNILSIYNSINIHFYIIQSKYNEPLLDKNKDDFLCQYLYHHFNSNNQICVLISNDLYRDNTIYIPYFLTLSYLKIHDIYCVNNVYSKNVIFFDLKKHNSYHYQTHIHRQSVPKNHIPELINR
jgi:hypothetical protein